MTQTKKEMTHLLSFMGESEPEWFRCRIYTAPEPEPLTREQAIEWLLDETSTAGANGIYPPRGESWDALVDEMCSEGNVHLYSGLLFAGPDFKRPGER